MSRSFSSNPSSAFLTEATLVSKAIRDFLKAKNFSSIVSLGLQRLSSSSLLKIGFILQSKAFRYSLKQINWTEAIELEHFCFVFVRLRFCSDFLTFVTCSDVGWIFSPSRSRRCLELPFRRELRPLREDSSLNLRPKQSFLGKARLQRRTSLPKGNVKRFNEMDVLV